MTPRGGHKIIEVNLGQKIYSPLLAEIPKPPKTLYCRGNLKLLRSPSFGIVGARAITPYGKEAAAKITQDLVAQGFTIVSGLAMGVDAAAHAATLAASGHTIAVLGGGTDDKTIGPRTNYQLAQEILAHDGLIVSEYPTGFQPSDFTFPARNRIISGLSHGILVVEANEKSGALITAQYALEQGRDVFAIPGSIFSQRSAGPHRLIQKGAKLVLSAHDILDEYTAQPGLFPSVKATANDPREQAILTALESGASLPDEITTASGLVAQEVLATLAMLEIKGSIVRTSSGSYRLK